MNIWLVHHDRALRMALRRLIAAPLTTLLSLLAIGALTAVFCYVPLQTVIEGAVTVRIAVQFIGQIAALHILRTRRPDVPLPFRMWLYPMPALLALIGWIFLWATSGLTLLLIVLIVRPEGLLPSRQGQRTI